MARAQSQYLRMFDAQGIDYQRWQSYYGNITVSFNSKEWLFMPFEADGFTAGTTGEEASISIKAPATAPVVEAFNAAITAGRFCELSYYQFDSSLGNSSPQAGQVLTARYIGQVVGGSATATELTLQLGSALSPVGVQVPPRRLTTEIMGKGCQL